MDQNLTLKKIIEELTCDAEGKDLAEDFRYGRGKRKNELPKGLRHKEDRQKRLLEAKRLIEEKQQLEVEAQQVKIDTRVQEERETGKKKLGCKPNG